MALDKKVDQMSLCWVSPFNVLPEKREESQFPSSSGMLELVLSISSLYLRDFSMHIPAQQHHQGINLDFYFASC